MWSRANVDSLPMDNPLDFWVIRMDHWPEPTQYTIELFGSPAASMFSEHTFSVVGVFVSEKKVGCLQAQFTG